MGYILECGYYNSDSFGIFVLKRGDALIIKKMIFKILDMEGINLNYCPILKLYKLEFTRRILNYFRKIYWHNNYRNYVSTYYLNCNKKIQLAYLSGYVLQKQNIEKKIVI